ncbi:MULTISPECIES: hypothetical protein [unclassified Oleiphilus]|uniref:hypothetical protein n=3 Tax=Oleiphilus TaxID=141450 RepID=UPI0012E7C523|nr:MULTISPECIES: hypothetical protein [unclassified Oleiphilus]MCH2158446.1 hypothetical protein [Oleiphilaceae bacterium]
MVIYHDDTPIAPVLGMVYVDVNLNDSEATRFVEGFDTLVLQKLKGPELGIEEIDRIRFFELKKSAIDTANTAVFAAQLPPGLYTVFKLTGRGKSVSYGAPNFEARFGVWSSFPTFNIEPKKLTHLGSLVLQPYTTSDINFLSGQYSKWSFLTLTPPDSGFDYLPLTNPVNHLLLKSTDHLSWNDSFSENKYAALVAFSENIVSVSKTGKTDQSPYILTNNSELIIFNPDNLTIQKRDKINGYTRATSYLQTDETQYFGTTFGTLITKPNSDESALETKVDPNQQLFLAKQHNQQLAAIGKNNRSLFFYLSQPNESKWIASHTFDLPDDEATQHQIFSYVELENDSIAIFFGHHRIEWDLSTNAIIKTKLEDPAIDVEKLGNGALTAQVSNRPALSFDQGMTWTTANREKGRVLFYKSSNISWANGDTYRVVAANPKRNNQGPRNKFKTGKLQIAEFNIDDIKRPLKWNYYGLIDKDCYQLNASLSSESTTVTSCLSGHLMSSRDGDVWSNILPAAPTREEIDTFLLEQRIPKRLITEFNLNPPLIIPVVAP